MNPITTPTVDITALSFSLPHIHSIPIPEARQAAKPASRRARRGNKEGRKSNDWNRHERHAYGRLLLSYLMNNMDVCESFLQHLGELLDKTPLQVYNYHRKMQSQFKTSNKIVTHILKHQREKDSLELSKDCPNVEQNAWLWGRGQQVQETSKEREFLQKLVIIQNSLDQYEDEYSDEVQVFELDDDQYLQESSTNGSFQQQGLDRGEM